jgi:predicted Rossmann fold nucleotide-binding protein DprA/Smf involved in DNA uptake
MGDSYLPITVGIAGTYDRLGNIDGVREDLNIELVRWMIVSGGAHGSRRRRAPGHALVNSGSTVAVLASGLDRPYSGPHAALFDDIAATGLVVSEYPPRTAPSRSQFLARNRLVAASRGHQA